MSQILQSNAAALVQAMHRRGIRYVFTNPGTDHAPIIEYLAEAKKQGIEVPQFIPVYHENLAVAMAAGYFHVTGKPAAVLVHVNVGTANAICGLINASRDNVPMLLLAGRTPVSQTGQPGSRSGIIHWGQDNFDQAGMVRGYVKWDYELHAGQPVDDIVGRAMEVALNGRPGPVYLTAAREVLAQPSVTENLRDQCEQSQPAVPEAAAIETLAARLLGGERSLLLTSWLGVYPQAVNELDALAEEFAIPLAQEWLRRVNLRSDHPMNLGAQCADWIESADVIATVAADVPWIPSKVQPPADAWIAHLGTDPLYQNYPYRRFPANLLVDGHPAAALRMLREAMSGMASDYPEQISARRQRVEQRQTRKRASRQKRLDSVRQNTPIHPIWLAECINRVRTENTIVVNELGVPVDFLQLQQPGSYIGQGTAGGLGAGLGLALGAKLGRPDALLIAVVGDGCYLFGNPTPFHMMAAGYNLPVLTIICNNGKWNAVRASTLGVYPDGAAASETTLPLVDFRASPEYSLIAEASGAWARRVDDPDELEQQLRAALQAVQAGQQALLDVRTVPGR